MIEVRMINEIAYCPRLAYLMYVDGLFEHNVHTIDGTLRHKKRRRSNFKGDTQKGGTLEQKGFQLSCPSLGLTGVFDGFIAENGSITLIEDKVGRGPTRSMIARASRSADVADAADAADVDDAVDADADDVADVADVDDVADADADVDVADADDVDDVADADVDDVADATPPASISVRANGKTFQLSPHAYHNDQAQVACYYLLLASNGYVCSSAHISYLGSKRRVSIDFTESLLGYARALIRDAQTLASISRPSPLVNSPKCSGCSLNEICLPNEVNYLNNVQASKPRRLMVPHVSGGILYVTTQGSYLRKSGEILVLTTPDGRSDNIPLINISSVCVFGNVQLSTQLIRSLGSRGCAVQYLSYYGRYESICHSPLSTNIKLRIKQFDEFGSSSRRLYLSRRIVESKIRNQRTLLRRNLKVDISGSPYCLDDLRRMYVKSQECESQESLLGIEGYAAKAYWSLFSYQFQGDDFTFTCRNRRPPRDPVNVLLSLGYTLLLRDVYIALSSIGFDPYRGFYHTSEYKRPSLALDMMEPYRPIIVDSSVLRSINQGIVKSSDFSIYKGGCYIRPRAKRRFINVYEQRMGEVITHPSFDYSLSYRRTLVLESRLLARYIQGDISDYTPLTVR